MMGYFLREGSWSANDYKGPYQQRDLRNVGFNDGSGTLGCRLYYDGVGRTGESTTSYLAGSTVTYCKYVEFGNIIPLTTS